MLSLTNFTRPAYTDASSSRTGTSLWQWPHRGEKNSTNTGPSKPRTSFAKAWSDIETGLSGNNLEGGSEDLQRPHTALLSPHLFAGMRFFAPHCGQCTIMLSPSIGEIYSLQAGVSTKMPGQPIV